MTEHTHDREHWEQIAETYDAEYHSTVHEAFEKEISSWLARQFTPADTVLELGCGTGIFSAMIAQHVEQLTATDFSSGMLARATQRLGGYDNVEVGTEDAHHTSFADGSFSAVLAANLLHHADAPADILRECHRVLTPGGKAIVIDCAGHGTPMMSWLWMSLKRVLRRPRPPEDHHHFSADDLTALLTDAAFAVQETTMIRQRRPGMEFICLRATKAP